MTEQTAKTITRYRVMVTAVVSNDGDVRSYCYAGQSWAGLSEGRANSLVNSLTQAIGLGVVLKAWTQPFECPTVKPADAV